MWQMLPVIFPSAFKKNLTVMNMVLPGKMLNMLQWLYC